MPTLPCAPVTSPAATPTSEGVALSVVIADLNALRARRVDDVFPSRRSGRINQLHNTRRQPQQLALRRQVPARKHRGQRLNSRRVDLELIERPLRLPVAAEPRTDPLVQLTHGRLRCIT